MNDTHTSQNTPAEEIPALLDQLYVVVETRESIVTHRRVRRGPHRVVAVPDIRPHTTRRPGLLVQLGVNGGTGASVPSNSPGWDADGALAPMASGSTGPAEPVTQAWFTADEIDRAISDLAEQLHAEGHRGSFVDIALADQAAGRRIARRLRSLVSRARIAAAYDSPIVPLRDVCCPECGGELRVRTDASSAVWCAGAWTIEGPAERGEPWPARARCGATWPRGSWVTLLEEATREAG